MLEYDLLTLRTMNNMDSHPRVLSLSSASSTHTTPSIVPTHPTGTPPTYTSACSTSPHGTSPHGISPHGVSPYGTTPRLSTDSQHAAHHFIHLQHSGKTEGRLNASIKKLWRGVKEVTREHHRSVNAAYEATHGSGVRGLEGVRV